MIAERQTDWREQADSRLRQIVAEQAARIASLERDLRRAKRVRAGQ